MFGMFQGFSGTSPTCTLTRPTHRTKLGFRVMTHQNHRTESSAISLAIRRTLCSTVLSTLWQGFIRTPPFSFGLGKHTWHQSNRTTHCFWLFGVEPFRDDAPHIWNDTILNPDVVKDLIFNQTDLLMSAFNDTQVFAAIGNHDWSPKSQLPPTPHATYREIQEKYYAYL